MLSYKLQFYANVRAYFQEIEKAEYSIIATGDFNICHREIDIARPEANKDAIGFLPIERAELDKIAEQEMVDVFRHLYPTLQDQYTWWSYRAGARARNVGWRIDYFWISKNLLPFVQMMNHQTEVGGSDHCPIVLDLKEELLTTMD